MSKLLHRSCFLIGNTATLWLSCFAVIAFADGNPSATSKPVCHLILVVGSPGAPEFGEQFEAWANDWRQLAKQSGASLTEISSMKTQEPSDLDRLRDEIAVQAASNADEQPLWLVLIGHGTFKSGVAKFNLQGPDISADQLKEWLKPLKRPLVVVNASAASGPFVNALSGPGRVVVTATRSGEEQNFARFGAYLPKALANANADLDHDDEVSLLEAVLMASADTNDFYASDDRIRTEHALIDDNGDQRGTPVEMLKSAFGDSSSSAKVSAKAGEEPAKLDGDTAAKWILVPSAATPALTEEEIAERAKIEEALAELRRKKANLAENEYYSQLEEKLLELSRIYESAENRAKLDASSP